MIQKWVYVICFLLICLTGCKDNSEQEIETFSISERTVEDYEQKIDKLLYDNYWRYDSTSITFFKGVVPENTEQNQAMFTSSSTIGLNMTTNAAKEAIVATVPLLYYNGEIAGLLYCYFVRDRLIGAYYVGGYNNGIYALTDRNVFLADGNFAKYETDTPFVTFQGKRTTFPSEGFCDIGQDTQGNLLAANISEDGKLSLYRYRSSFGRYRNIYLQRGLVVDSAAFLEEGMAVILSRAITEGTEEGENTYTSSEKLVFLNRNFSTTGESIDLSNGNYTCVGFDGAELFLMNHKTLECYTKGEEGWTITNQYYLDHGASYMHITDIDGDGTLEYFITDGFDLYLYQKRETGFIKIWSTHLGIKSIESSIYSGDLNRDGVKEIYVCDTTGTAMRYILTENGLSIKNDDIVYGQIIYAMDLNSDGIDEYVGMNNIEDTNTMVYFEE